MGKRKQMSGKASFLSGVTDVFVLAVLGGHMLVFRDYYFDILSTKYYYYCACVITMAVLFVGYEIFTWIAQTHTRNGKNVGKDSRKKGNGNRNNNDSGFRFWKTFNMVDWMVFLFTVIAAISTVLSPYKSSAFWGNEGRYTGLFLMLLYAVAYFCVTRQYRIKRWHMEVFLIAGLLVCLLGITDFFDMDLLHFKVNIKETQRYMFTSTIGNINTYTACVAMVMAVAGVLFATCSGAWKNVWYGFGVAVSMMALIMGESDNAYLSLAAFFGFLPLYTFRNRSAFKKYFVILAIFFTVIWGITGIIARFGGVGMELEGLFRVIAGFSELPLVVVFLWLIAAALYLIAVVRKKTASGVNINEKAIENNQVKSYAVTKDLPSWLIYVWWGVIAAVILTVLLALYDVNVAGHIERYGTLSGYLHFTDDWGTRRGYIWRMSIEEYMKYPLLQKIFGYGPDTFSLVAYFNRMKEMADVYNMRFDSVHNELLQYFVTVGPFGTLAYLGILVTAVWNVVKSKLDNPVVVGAILAVVCYNFQALVNINQPIATPIMWMLLSIAVVRRE